jgi:transcriptional accessory protein Tex/SPT6
VVPGKITSPSTSTETKELFVDYKKQKREQATFHVNSGEGKNILSSSSSADTSLRT